MVNRLTPSRKITPAPNIAPVLGYRRSRAALPGEVALEPEDQPQHGSSPETEPLKDPKGRAAGLEYSHGAASDRPGLTKIMPRTGRSRW